MTTIEEQIAAYRDATAITDSDRSRCAAWLVHKHKAVFRRSRGVMEFKLPKRDEMPVWFSAAIECLSKRKGWVVDLLTIAPYGLKVRIMRTPKIRLYAVN